VTLKGVGAPGCGLVRKPTSYLGIILKAMVIGVVK